MDVGVVATHISPAKGYGGVSVTAAVLTKAWAEHGHKITLVAAAESMDGALASKDVRLGESVKVDLYSCYGFRRWGFGLGAIPKIFRLCQNAPVVYIHGIATWPSTLAALFCVLLCRPFMVAVHGGLMPEHVALIRQKKPHKWLFYRLLTLPTLRRAIAIHCTSETEEEGVRNVLGENAKTLLVPNGINNREVQVFPYPKAEGITICFLGHIQQEKGINAFIKAWLPLRRPGDQLMVAGRSVDRTYFKEFQSLVEQAQGHITYLGYLERNQVMELLAVSHFLVLPSGLESVGGMRENFGNVVAEAMAAGRPVLLAKGLAWDFVESIGAGFVFDRTEVSASATIMWMQHLQREKWDSMSHKARTYVEQHLDAGKLGEQVWQVLNNPVKSPMVRQLSEGSAYE